MPWVAPATRRYGVRATICAAGLTQAGMLATTAQVDGSAAALALRFAGGAAGGLVIVAMNAQDVKISSLLPRPILGILHGTCSLGSMVGSAFNALAAS